MEVEIKKITGDEMLEKSLTVIRRAFLTVADEFNLTEENCPTNGAFIGIDELREMKGKGIAMFGLSVNNEQVGFVAVEKANDEVFYIEKLAVLPEYRHNGYGRMLLDFAFEHVKNNNGKKVSIAIINENKILKDWYTSYGFTETMVKEFPHLPFKVCFMEKAV